MKIIYNLLLLLLLQFPFACNESLEFKAASLVQGSGQVQKSAKSGAVAIVFKSTDGGQKWQDMSEGLPENLQIDSIRGNSFFANDKGLFLKVGSELYHSTPNATAPFWTKELFLDEHSGTAPR